MASSIQNQYQNSISKINALKSYNDTSKAEQTILNKAGDSLTNLGNNVADQLSKLKEKQKRYQRDTPTSVDRILDLITATKGSGPETFKYLRRLVIQTFTKIGPQVQTILTEEITKALGCSQEQSYSGINLSGRTIPSLQLLPVSDGLYIPVKSVDILGNLKIQVDDWKGKLFYEQEVPSGDDRFVPYGGRIPYPVNRMLKTRTDALGQTYEQFTGKFYNGRSTQNLFDVSYVTENNLGERGDYFRVFLLDREDVPVNPNGQKINLISTFITDYYSTIDLFSIPQVVASMVNFLTGAVSINARLGFGEIEMQSKFALLLNRILGLCFDERKEIDVSGISKLGELDGIDESFFEFSDVDLRNIQLEISNIQQGVTSFEECGNVQLPVESQELVNKLVEFSTQISGKTNEQIVNNIEAIIDSIANNQQWNLLVPNDVGIQVAVDRSFIKKLPIAIIFSVLTPKVLLPLFVFLYELERSGNITANTLITSGNSLISSANTFLESGNTIGQQVNNSVEDGVDFIKKNKTFIINVTSRINAVFIELLFESLKRDIFNLLSVIVKDIQKTQAAKQYAIIIRLVQIAYIVVNFVKDYRKCKSLLDEITQLLSLIGGRSFTIPPFLNLFASFLPGFSPERATLNLIEKLEKLGIPTGAMPDGSQNMMNLFSKQLIGGIDEEEAANGKVSISLQLPPPFGLISGSGKKY